MSNKEEAGLKLDRVPPQNLDSERAVLGAMVMGDAGKAAIAAVIEVLGEEEPYAFYREAHQKIYGAILNLFDRGIPADLLTVTQELERTGDLEKVGGVTYMDEMIDSVPTAANAAWYAVQVLDESRRRRLIQLCATVYNDSFHEESDLDELLQKAESEIFQIMSEKGAMAAIPIKKAIKPAFDHIQEMYESDKHILGIPTGFIDLDKLISGLQKGESIIVGGRPGMGKSMFVMNIAEYVAMQMKIPVLIFSLETGSFFFSLRMLSAESRIPFQHIKTGKLEENDWPKLTIAAGEISEARIFIDETPGLSPLEIRARARKIQAQHGIGLIIIDYLQLMSSDGKYGSREQAVSAASGSMKRLAMELDVPVITCSQLSRKPEGRPSNRPQLSDLRESGAIEQDADLVVFLYREFYYDRSAPNDVAEVIIGKQRSGPIGTVKLVFHGDVMRFENMKGW